MDGQQLQLLTEIDHQSVDDRLKRGIRTILEAYLSTEGAALKLSRLLEPSDCKEYLVYSMRESTLAGYLYYERADGDLQNCLCGDAPVSVEGPFLLLKQAYIAPEYRGEGLGTVGTEAFLQTAYEHGIETIVVESWIKPNDRNSADACEEMGFEQRYYSESYFDSTQFTIGSSECFHCTEKEGLADCRCAGAIYVKQLSW